MTLAEILHTRFGFSQFRPHQEAVCQAVGIEGKDALVVMPTGAGKSLCYQVPGLVRNGPTLVISPLVALIEDQVHRLTTQGGQTPIRADRIHSGRAREDSRAALGAFIRRELDFLFIAPERLAVPGFSEMLRANPPSLIAVDEAHCISHWGHDFRPDYRLVGQRLGEIPNSPIIALTATATPLVQDDICAQLKLRDARRFIHGFRRDNLAVLLREALPSERASQMRETLREPGRLPAIVYAPTRAKAEEIAGALGQSFRCAAYHAGMPAADRERVQQDFIHERIQVIVATVAFGMGIDKANIRTVIHAALPASVEGYYQEIGRAGRDGLPSEALLLHGFSDRRTHDFFFERDYPETESLAKIFGLVGKHGTIPREALQARLPALEPDVFEKALDKLWAHRGIIVDADENVSAGPEPRWKKSYEDQRGYRQKQLDAMLAFTRAPGCRMLGLVRHFGDPTDEGKPCGLCDRCQPRGNLRTLDELERGVAAMVLASLSGKNGQAVGRLFEEAQKVDPRVARSGFERLLDALASARMIDISQDEFERDGKLIAFRRVTLMPAGRSAKADALAQVAIEGGGMIEAKVSRDRKRKASTPPPARRASPSSSPSTSDDPSAPSELPRLFDTLRAWRREAARKKGLPPFRILSDRVLHALCEHRPADEATLLMISGIGPKIVSQYGPELLTAIAADR